MKFKYSNINPWTDEDNKENLISKVKQIFYEACVQYMIVAVLALGMFTFGLLVLNLYVFL